MGLGAAEGLPWFGQFQARGTKKHVGTWDKGFDIGLGFGGDCWYNAHKVSEGGSSK